MATCINFEPANTYATVKTLTRVVEQYYSDKSIKYVICKTDSGRYYPVFIGNAAIENRVFMKFCVIN